MGLSCHVFFTFSFHVLFTLLLFTCHCSGYRRHHCQSLAFCFSSPFAHLASLQCLCCRNPPWSIPIFFVGNHSTVNWAFYVPSSIPFQQEPRLSQGLGISQAGLSSKVPTTRPSAGCCTSLALGLHGATWAISSWQRCCRGDQMEASQTMKEMLPACDCYHYCSFSCHCLCSGYCLYSCKISK